MKYCIKCKKNLPEECFYPSYLRNYIHICKECDKKYRKEHSDQIKQHKIKYNKSEKGIITRDKYYNKTKTSSK